MQTFKRTIENFVCGNCGESVKGNGYTNHCPECLYSKHVDVFPGDRASTCGGLMEPIDLFQNTDFSILHECAKCGRKKKNRTAKDDHVEVFFSRNQ